MLEALLSNTTDCPSIEIHGATQGEFGSLPRTVEDRRVVVAPEMSRTKQSANPAESPPTMSGDADWKLRNRPVPETVGMVQSCPGCPPVEVSDTSNMVSPPPNSGPRR